MAHVSTVFLFITLLQLCLSARTTWYNANVINDGEFSPKTLSEIFSSTEAPPVFSTKNPIVVLPRSSPQTGISTSSIQYNTDGFGTRASTTPSPIEYESTSPTFPTQSTFEETQPTFSLPTQPNTPGWNTVELQPFTFSTQQPATDNKGNFPPDFFSINQQPQTVPSDPQQQFGPQTTFSTLPPQFSTPQSTFSTFRPEISSTTFSTATPEFSSPQSTFSTARPDISTVSSTFSTSRPDITRPATVSSSPNFTPRQTTFQPEITSTLTTFTQQSSSTSIPSSRSTGGSTLPPNPTSPPCRNGTARLPLGPNYPALRIRMVAPSGSITNIHLNQPTSTRPPTTRRRTTPRPRTPKPAKNNYDRCLRSCNGKKPICAAPLATLPIDPETLKGFPSICHMACFNSFKKVQYEMLTDGRCGKLRNRIRPLDSNTKLKRTELNKVQYTIVNDPQTIVEVQSSNL